MGRGNDDALNKNRVRPIGRGGRLLLLARTDRAAVAPAEWSKATARSVVVRPVTVRATTVTVRAVGAVTVRAVGAVTVRAVRAVRAVGAVTVRAVGAVTVRAVGAVTVRAVRAVGAVTEPHAERTKAPSAVRVGTLKAATPAERHLAVVRKRAVATPRRKVQRLLRSAVRVRLIR
jgi:hypothetical protein